MNIKRYTVLLIALLTLLLLTACSARSAAQSLDAAEDAVERKLDQAEDAVEDALRGVVTQPSSGPETAAAGTPEGRISPEQAQEIALSHGGFTPGQVDRLRAEPDFDDRVKHYDVTFREGIWEYEYEIHAETGEILSWEKDD